ncbi:MAG: iron-containing alcohol dehydrogenase [Roseovarius sp.]|jgi:alcohol dehydrogenase|uniref:iron-containing alcohol dehydrogenase n=1 Tax=Roseovarius sp. TaxID=1486281 RepID=UPI0032EC1568
MLLSTSSYYCPTKTILGNGCYRQIPELLADFSASKVLLVVDPALAETGYVKDIREMLTQRCVTFETFTDIEPDPGAHSVADALEISGKLEAELVLAIGGGSTIDVAKAVAIVSTNGGRIHDYEGIEKFSIDPLPLIAMPTTAGTGSEVSGSCVITDKERGTKMSIRHPRLNPARVALLDPQALQSLPPHVASHSGLDAFVHAFESYISRNSNPFSDAVTLHAIRMISHNLRQHVANPANTEAALEMLCGSALAGMAFGQTGLGNVHCMARFIGARYHISHGLSNALCLPVVAQFNMISSPERYRDVAQAMGCNIENLSLMEAANAAVAAITELCHDLGIPSHLSEIGVKEEDIPELAKLCIGAGYNKWNPRLTSEKDFVALFKEAL